MRDVHEWILESFILSVLNLSVHTSKELQNRMLRLHIINRILLLHITQIYKLPNNQTEDLPNSNKIERNVTISDITFLSI